MDDGEEKSREPRVPILGRDGYEREGGLSGGEEAGTPTEGGGATIETPSLSTVDVKAPDEEGGGEEEGEGGVADVSD
ncbi:hypothetical protein, partial [Bacillus cereus]|uniref:hypothetical protein n=1 Tax=Bacillus cereus TaxID=1396 RepID=UPI00345C3177